MNILLVEDDENKQKQITNLLKREWPDAHLELKTSLQSGLRALSEQVFSLVILDMSLPNYEIGPEESGGTIHKLGGREFLRKMKRRARLIPTVVVTQYDTFGEGRERVDLSSLRSELARDYPGLCIGTLYYNSAIDSWREELTTLVRTVHGGRTHE